MDGKSVTMNSSLFIVRGYRLFIDETGFITLTERQGTILIDDGPDHGK